MPNKTITIQSMCDTKTDSVAQTVKQIKALAKEGCDLVRVAVPTLKAAKAIAKIRRALHRSHIHIPLIADIHFDPALAIAAINAGADKIRINPSNIKDKPALKNIAALAKKRKIPIRIGINAGSFSPPGTRASAHGANARPRPPTPQTLVKEAIKWIKFFESVSFKNLVISIKSSDIETTIKANELLHQALKRRKTPYPIHLGLTEAGTLIQGVVKSTIALSHLLKKGIGNTIRLSLTEDPIQGVRAAKELLKALGLYAKEPTIISCPTCGRTEIDLKSLVKKIEDGIKKLKIKKPYRIAVMGCVVNGPGEARHADYAICGGRQSGAIYKHGHFVKSVPEKTLVKEFLKLIKCEK